jgi:hypothetical protein
MFNLGDHVKWLSQTKGFSKEKVGEIVHIVPVCQRPDSRFLDLYKKAGWGRAHESYVVKVGNSHYWPAVKNLVKTIN